MRAPVAAVERGVRVEWISTPSELEAIETAWRDLEAEVHQRTHVATFDFLATWYRHYAGDYGGTPLVGLAWHGSELAGVAPLTIRCGRLGRIPVTRIDFAPNDSVAGEFLVRDGQPEVAAALLDSLVRRVRFDVICLNGFPPDSGELLAVQDAARQRRLSTELEDHAYTQVDLRSGYDQYRAALSGNTRRKVAQKERRIQALGASVEGVLPADAWHHTEETMHRLIAINEASYKLRGERLAGHHRAFLTEIVERFAARHMLSLPILSIDGRDAAYILGVVERGCFYDVGLAYDDAFAHLGPGVYLMQQTLRGLAGAGVHTVVSHGAHEYKRHWATAFVPQTRIFLFSSRPRAAAARLLRFHLQPLWQRLSARAGLPRHDAPSTD
ncbi:MAG: GNAT family N-acetyltransferase [Vicinamibacterales bacterium]